MAVYYFSKIIYWMFHPWTSHKFQKQLPLKLRLDFEASQYLFKSQPSNKLSCICCNNCTIGLKVSCVCMNLKRTFYNQFVGILEERMGHYNFDNMKHHFFNVMIFSTIIRWNRMTLTICVWFHDDANNKWNGK